MMTKELIELLKEFPQDADVMIEVGGNAMYVPIGKPYVRNLGRMGCHSDYVCIGGDVKIY